MKRFTWDASEMEMPVPGKRGGKTDLSREASRGEGKNLINNEPYIWNFWNKFVFVLIRENLKILNPLISIMTKKSVS